METSNGVKETDPWFGLQAIESDELYPTIENGITRLDTAAKMEHPILEVNYLK
jgi:hypothetical protein